MNHLNAQQLAFILDITKQEARDKMLMAYASENNIQLKFTYKEVDGKEPKREESYPLAMEIEMLSRRLNLPTLQAMVDDICNKYLVRPASRKWILCDYPEKEITKVIEGTHKKISIPATLRSFLSAEQIKEIHKQWHERFPKYA